MSRRVFINLLAFLGVFALMLFWAVNNIITFDFIERPYELRGEFAATAGVSENSEVAYLGVNYGRVRSVEAVDRMVLITMDIDRDKEIPAGSFARIFRKSAIGEPYIDFVPPDDYEEGDPTIEPDSLIPLERTSVPLEFSELLRSASRVLSGVDPDQTRTLVHELAVALNGRGEALRDLTVDSDALLQTFADRTELLDSLSSNSTRLTRTVTERRGALSSAVSDLADVAETLRTVEPDTRVLLDRGTRLLGETADLVSDVKQDLDCLLHDLDDLIDLTTSDQQLADLSYMLDNGPTGFGYVFMTRDAEPGGLWVRVNVIARNENPANQYVPPRQLPPVPAVPPCVSSLSSTGTDFVAGQPTASTGRVAPLAVGAALPATGGQPLPALALTVLAATGMALAARRRSQR